MTYKRFEAEEGLRSSMKKLVEDSREYAEQFKHPTTQELTHAADILARLRRYANESSNRAGAELLENAENYIEGQLKRHIRGENSEVPTER